MTLLEGGRSRSDRPDVARRKRRADPRQHREDVIRRLLGRGVSPGTLRTVLPDFRSIIDRLAARS